MEKTLSPEEKEKIEALLKSPDSDNHLLATEILKTFGLYSDYLTKAFIEYIELRDAWVLGKERTGERERAQRKRLLAMGGKRLKELMWYQYTFGSDETISERGILRNIKAVSTETGINGVQLAEYCYTNFGLGSSYLIMHGDEQTQYELLEERMYETTLDLSNLGLSLIPSAIYQFQDIEVLNLSHNRVQTIPRWVLKLPKLRYINATYNKVRKVHPDVEQYFAESYLDRGGNLKPRTLSLYYNPISNK
ncbi:MAG: leucine-rich repeat domain-containing protein [Aureispira sp.]|nr:leucine-rich repeat domain-containing protein [Aureispira sp.]